METEDTETEDKNNSLYNMIVEETDLEHEDDETVEDYKERLVTHFNDMDDDAFAALPNEVSDWADAAIKATKANRGARNKKPLPAIDGLEEPAPAEEPAAKRGRGRPKKDASAADGAEKSKRTPPKRAENAGPSKRQQLEGMLTKKGGATHDAMKEALGWPSGCLTTARKIAVSLNKELVKEKRGDETYYSIGG